MIFLHILKELVRFNILNECSFNDIAKNSFDEALGVFNSDYSI